MTKQPSDAKIRYVVKKVCEELRSKISPDADLLAELHSASAIDQLREELASDLDEQLLFDLAKNGSEPVHKLAVAILQNRREDSRIRSLFMSLWKQRPDQSKIRINLMWRLLDYQELPTVCKEEASVCHEEIYQFVCDHWSDFIETQIGFMGEGRSDRGEGYADRVLPNIEQRLKDGRFPTTKRWAYLCSSLASEDIPGILRLLSEYSKPNAGCSEDKDFIQFYGNIVHDLKERCRSLLEKHLRENDHPRSKVASSEEWSRHDLRIWDLYHKNNDHERRHHSRVCGVQRGLACDLTMCPRGAPRKTVVWSKAERAFDHLVDKLEQAGQGSHQSIADDCLREWKWYAWFANYLDQFRENDLGQTAVDRMISDAGEWAMRFACLHRVAADPGKGEDDEMWFRGSLVDPRVSLLPIPCRAPDAESLVRTLPDAMKKADKNNGGGSAGAERTAADILVENLCTRLRVVQWEVMPRDRFQEVVHHQILQVPKVSDFLGKPGGLLAPKKHEALAMAFWRKTIMDSMAIEGENDPTSVAAAIMHVSLIAAKKKVGSIASRIGDLVTVDGRHTEEVTRRYSSFLRFIAEQACVKRQRPPLNNSLEPACRTDTTNTHVIVVEDGELTFFCLLWHIRTSMVGAEPSDYRIRFAEISECQYFMTRLGLICPVGEKKWGLTSRFQSFARWFLRLHSQCIGLEFKSTYTLQSFVSKAMGQQGGLEGPFPARILTGDAGPPVLQFTAKLFVLLRSSALASGIRAALVKSVFDDPIDLFRTLFQKVSVISLETELQNQKLSGLLRLLDVPEETAFFAWAFSREKEGNKVNESKPDEDPVLFSVSRTAYLPVEELIRSYQPCEMNLLIIPYDFRFPTTEREQEVLEKAGIHQDLAAPTAITFATVIGGIRADDHAENKGTCAGARTSFSSEWLHMYWSTFQAITSQIITRSYEDMFKSLSAYHVFRNESSRQGHEVKGIIRCISPGAHNDLLTLVRSYFYSVTLDSHSVLFADLYLPEEYHNREEVGLKEFVERGLGLATRLLYLAKAGGEDLRSMDAATISKGVKEIGRTLGIANSLTSLVVRKTSSGNELDKQRIFFLALIVATLRNIVKHSMEIAPVVVRRVGEKSRLEFINVPRICPRNLFGRNGNLEAVMDGTLSFEPDMPRHRNDAYVKYGGTEQALEAYLELFPEGTIEKGTIQLFQHHHTELFVSRIPFPPGLVNSSS